MASSSASDERHAAVHELAEAVAVLVLGTDALNAGVTGQAARDVLADMKAAAGRIAPLFERLRRVI